MSPAVSDQAAPGSARPTVTATVADDVRFEDGDEPLRPERWSALAAAVLADEGVSGALDLSFVGVDTMAGLNVEHMGHDGPTDVLSFPLDDAANAPADDDVPVLLGDVVICPTYAAEQAPEHRSDRHGGTLDDELALLVVHGVLHVLGWDHATDDEREAMQARERHHLDAWSAAGVRRP